MQETIVEVTELRDMAERFGAADRETRYMIIERLVERIEIGLGTKSRSSSGSASGIIQARQHKNYPRENARVLHIFNALAFRIGQKDPPRPLYR